MSFFGFLCLSAKLVGGERYSILSDYLGTPIQAYDARGNIVWECELDIYGKVRNLHGEKTFIPFRFSGQYEDIETGLYYNRFRYYSPDTGTYISQDPIGLLGNNPNLYAYVHDVNSWVDPFGLAGNPILFCSKFWKSVGGISSKTFLRVKGADVFEIKGKPKLDGLKKGDLFHLDTLHLDEIEVYNKSKMHKGVYDLDGNKIGEAIKGRTCK
ncbi:RHS repeat domain-containing protein [Tenacibaculum maritimum]|uniref:RHS repeat domain-containing protein n=1 Tax=Tenacibaculum maritimum TaxID=107401 RepID=UPI00132F5760|nr:RHS repeat-associated core domain-containing protein [Tenacibaculum maritimum]